MQARMTREPGRDLRVTTQTLQRRLTAKLMARRAMRRTI